MPAVLLTTVPATPGEDYSARLDPKPWQTATPVNVWAVTLPPRPWIGVMTK